MELKEEIGIVEHLLRTRMYTEKERAQIIATTNKQCGTEYDEDRRKFQLEQRYGQYGLTLRRWYEDVLPKYEEDNYVV